MEFRELMRLASDMEKAILYYIAWFVPGVLP